MTIARRHLAAIQTGEKGEKGEKPPSATTSTTFSPFSPFSPTLEFGGLQPPLSTLPTSGGQWSPAEAQRLMEAADTLAECLGVDCRHPAITDAAATVISAFATRDIAILRTWVFEFELLVRSVAAAKVNIPQEGKKGDKGEKSARTSPDQQSY